jgi:putative peptidoglycan lipid II flippase
MVERILRVIHREWSGLHEAALLLGGFALLSQVLGLIRDRMLAHEYGAGSSLDIYYAAFRIPDFLYASLASFVAVTVLIPFILEKIEGSATGEEEGKRFFQSVFTAFFGIIGLVALIAFILMPVLAPRVVPGFAPKEMETFISLSRILLLSPIILGVSNLFGSVTQTYRRFLVFALGPVLYNIGIIFGIVFLLPSFGLPGLAWGVILGALLHLSIQIPVIVRHGYLPRFPKRFDTSGVLRVVRTSLPRTIALSATHFTTIILVALGSSIAEGSISVFQLAFNLQSIPLAIVGMSYSVAAFPTLARQWTEGKAQEFALEVATAMRHIIFWSFPAIALFVVLRAQIVRTVLGTGAFDWTATRLTAAALALFAVSVVAQSILLLLLRAFYATGETRTPLRWSLVGAVSTVLSAYVLVTLFERSDVFRFFVESLLRVDDIQGTKVLMLPLAFSIGSIVSASALFFVLVGKFKGHWDGVRKAFFHAFTSSVFMGLVAYHGLQFLDDVLDINTFHGIFLQGLLAGITGIIAGIFLLRLMENREIVEIWMSLHRRFWKSKPIAAEQEGL